jgi:aminoglycoside 2''-phosphotransferase
MASDHPWDADRELTQEVVRRVLAEQVPELQIHVLRLLGSGWDNDAYLVNEELVFRFPRRKSAAEVLNREVGVLRAVKRVFEGADFGVPQVHLVGQASEAFPYPFMAYRMLPGIGVDQVDPEVLEKPALARALGDAFTRIHRMTEADFQGFELPKSSNTPKGWFARAQRVAEAVLLSLEDEQLKECCASWLANPQSVPASYSGPLRIIHSDICPDHVLADPKTGVPTALIDFADLEWGDPVGDFVSFRCWLGPEFMNTVLENYGHPLDHGFWPRLEWISRCASLVWIQEVLVRNQRSQLAKHVQWVRTSFMDSTQPRPGRA